MTFVVPTWVQVAAVLFVFFGSVYYWIVYPLCEAIRAPKRVIHNVETLNLTFNNFPGQK